MLVLELSNNYCKKYYNGNFEEMIKNKDGVIYDTTINITEKNLKRWMKNNKVFCKYYDLENKKYI